MYVGCPWNLLMASHMSTGFFFHLFQGNSSNLWRGGSCLLQKGKPQSSPKNFAYVTPFSCLARSGKVVYYLESLWCGYLVSTYSVHFVASPFLSTCSQRAATVHTNSSTKHTTRAMTTVTVWLELSPQSATTNVRANLIGIGDIATLRAPCIYFKICS